MVSLMSGHQNLFKLFLQILGVDLQSLGLIHAYFTLVHHAVEAIPNHVSVPGFPFTQNATSSGFTVWNSTTFPTVSSGTRYHDLRAFTCLPTRLGRSLVAISLIFLLLSYNDTECYSSPLRSPSLQISSPPPRVMIGSASYARPLQLQRMTWLEDLGC